MFFDWIFFSEESSRATTLGYWISDIVFTFSLLIVLVIFQKRGEIKTFFLFGVIGLFAELGFTLIGFRYITAEMMAYEVIVYFGIAFCDCAVFSTMAFILLKALMGKGVKNEE